MDNGPIPLSLYSEPETSLIQLSQLSGTAKVVWNGAIMAGNFRKYLKLPEKSGSNFVHKMNC